MNQNAGELLHTRIVLSSIELLGYRASTSTLGEIPRQIASAPAPPAKILLKPRSARQEKLQRACGAAREVQDLLDRAKFRLLAMLSTLHMVL